MEKYSEKFFFFLFYLINVFEGYIRGFLISRNIFIFFINKFYILFFVNFFKYNLLCNFSTLLDLIVVDNVNINQNRFHLTYLFWNIYYGQRFGIKIQCNHLYGIFSINKFYSNANWLEREVWDMFGLKFFLHGNLSRILTDYGFKSFPLRKDFPLSGYLDLFYDNSLQLLRYLPVEFAQNFRFFNLLNPWI